MNNIDRIAGVVNSQCVRLTSSPINEAYCFAGLTLFPDGGKDHCQYSSMDGLTELAWVTGLDSTWTNRVDVCNVITTSGVVVPERRAGKHFGAGTAFR